MTEHRIVSPADEAGQRALDAVCEAIEKSRNFKLEAGAGAGKTYSLVKSLRFVIEHKGTLLRRLSQRIACITFTNVAKDEIEARIDRNPLVHCDTIHAFCWSTISGYQAHLRKNIPELSGWMGDPWGDRLTQAGGVGFRHVSYSLGYRGISDDAVSLHHDDVLPLTIKLLEYEKFRHIFCSRYPIIFIDEYQDTDADWINSIQKHFLASQAPPLFGFFGDHWQKIYRNGCGEIVFPGITAIGKEANFRSVPAIVECLNRMRPELKQFVVDPNADGEVRVFHTNGWSGGQRQKGQHHGGDLPDVAANEALAKVKKRLSDSGWDFSPKQSKILMLTHRVLGKQQGYSSLPSVFKYNNSFTKKEQPHIAFFVDYLEPACRAFEAKRYGEMFRVLGANKCYLFSASDKKNWSESMQHLLEIRACGSVGDVVKYLRDIKIPALPESVERIELKLASFDPSTEGEMPRALQELQKLHQVQYKEIVAVANYLDGHSPFETNHGVKGAEFENVLVVLGRGWNLYNFAHMLENARIQERLTGDNRIKFENNRNLFYVSCSRPRKRLALLFTQELSAGAMETVECWFGANNVTALYSS